MDEIEILGEILEAILGQVANGFDDEYDFVGEAAQVDWGFRRIFTPPRAWRRRLRMPRAPIRVDENLYLGNLFREPKQWRRSCRTVRPPATKESLKRSFMRGVRPGRIPVMLDYLAEIRRNQPASFQEQVDYYRDQVIPMKPWFGVFVEPKSWRKACRVVGAPKRKPPVVVEDQTPPRPETLGTREDVFVYSAPNWRTRLADWWTPPLAGRTDRALLAYLREQAMFMRRVDTLPVFLRAKATRWLDESGVKLDPAVREELVANVVMQAAVVGDKERRAIKAYQDFQRGPSTLKDIARLTTAVTLTLGLGVYYGRRLSLPEFQIYATLAGQSISHCSRQVMNTLSAPQVVAYATSITPWWRVTL